MSILVIDAYDSFVHTVAHYVAMLGYEPEVVRNSELTPEQVERRGVQCVVMGPGPGHPRDSGYVELIERLAGQIPLFGICLGHQAVGLAFGASVIRAKHLMHGKVSTVEHNGGGCFRGCRRPVRGMRYHSLIVDTDTVKAPLEATAWSADDGYVMALRHREHPVESVQFHPESISSEDGLQILDNFIGRYVGVTFEPNHPMIR